MKARATRREVDERPNEAISRRYIDVTRRARARSIFPHGYRSNGESAQASAAKQSGSDARLALAGPSGGPSHAHSGSSGSLATASEKDPPAPSSSALSSEPSTAARPPRAVRGEHLVGVAEEPPKFLGVRTGGAPVEREPPKPAQNRITHSALTNVRRALGGARVQGFELLRRAFRVATRKKQRAASLARCSLVSAPRRHVSCRPSPCHRGQGAPISRRRDGSRDRRATSRPTP